MTVPLRYLLAIAALCSVAYSAGFASAPGSDALDAIGMLGGFSYAISMAIVAYELRAAKVRQEAP